MWAPVNPQRFQGVFASHIQDIADNRFIKLEQVGSYLGMQLPVSSVQLHCSALVAWSFGGWEDLLVGSGCTFPGDEH